MSIKSAKVGYIELVVTSIIWGISYVLMKYALSFLSPQQIAFARFLIAAIMFAPLLLVGKERYSRKEILVIIVLALTGVLLYQLFFIWGEAGLSAGNASFIGSFEPIFIAVLGISARKDRLSWAIVAGLTVSTLGMLILLRPTSLNANEIFSAILVLLSALSWAIFTIVGKDLLVKHNPLNVTGYVSVIGLLMLIPFVNTTAAALFHIRDVSLIISLLFIGVFGTFAGYFLWFDGLTKVKPVAAGTTLYIVPFVTVIFASFLIAESISWTTVLGGTVILLGLVIAGMKSRKQLG